MQLPTGRLRLLVVASVADFAFYLAYTLTYLLVLNVAWRPPIPIYLEQRLIPLVRPLSFGAR